MVARSETAKESIMSLSASSERKFSTEITYEDIDADNPEGYWRTSLPIALQRLAWALTRWGAGRAVERLSETMTPELGRAELREEISRGIDGLEIFEAARNMAAIIEALVETHFDDHINMLRALGYLVHGLPKPREHDDPVKAAAQFEVECWASDHLETVYARWAPELLLVGVRIARVDDAGEYRLDGMPRLRAETRVEGRGVGDRACGDDGKQMVLGAA